jgi:hypothetical protein
MFQKGAPDILGYTKKPLLYRDYCVGHGPTGHYSCDDDAIDDGTVHASLTGVEVLGQYALLYLGRIIRQLGHRCCPVDEKVEEGNKKEALGSTLRQ